jgi:hypothetical protein
MTAHQDVAGLVARLRWLSSPEAERMSDYQRINNFVGLGVEAADRLESLSQALREAEAERDRWFAAAKTEAEGRQRMTTYRQNSFDRATAAESRLAEAMKLARYVSQESSQSLLRDAARAFIAGNGGKDAE